jgi:glutamate synthase (NADPH) small chain
MSLKKNEMPTQEPEIRAKNYKEVALGYSEKAALDEAARCLNCKNMPCVSGCPVNIEIPHFIKKITESEAVMQKEDNPNPDAAKEDMDDDDEEEDYE